LVFILRVVDAKIQRVQNILYFTVLPQLTSRLRVISSIDPRYEDQPNIDGTSSMHDVRRLHKPSSGHSVQN
jgi:hypothetical protein